MSTYMAFGLADDEISQPDRVTGSIRQFFSEPFEAESEDAAFKVAREAATKARGYCRSIAELHIIRVDGGKIPVPQPLYHAA